MTHDNIVTTFSILYYLGNPALLGNLSFSKKSQTNGMNRGSNKFPNKNLRQIG